MMKKRSVLVRVCIRTGVHHVKALDLVKKSFKILQNMKNKIEKVA